MAIATPSGELNEFSNNAITFLSGIGIGSLLSTLLGFYLTRKREEEVKKREASVAVADLLSKWVAPSYHEEKSDKYYWELQSLYWKTILGLDKKLLDVLIPLLANKKESKGTNDVVVKCRQILMGLRKPDLSGKELNNWFPKEVK